MISVWLYSSSKHMMRKSGLSWSSRSSCLSNSLWCFIGSGQVGVCVGNIYIYIYLLFLWNKSAHVIPLCFCVSLSLSISLHMLKISSCSHWLPSPISVSDYNLKIKRKRKRKRKRKKLCAGVVRERLHLSGFWNLLRVGTAHCCC